MNSFPSLRVYGRKVREASSRLSRERIYRHRKVEILECFRPCLAQRSMKIWEGAMNLARFPRHIVIDVICNQSLSSLRGGSIERVKLPIVGCQSVEVPTLISQLSPGINT